MCASCAADECEQLMDSVEDIESFFYTKTQNRSIINHYTFCLIFIQKAFLIFWKITFPLKFLTFKKLHKNIHFLRTLSIICRYAFITALCRGFLLPIFKLSLDSVFIGIIGKFCNSSNATNKNSTNCIPTSSLPMRERSRYCYLLST